MGLISWPYFVTHFNLGFWQLGPGKSVFQAKSEKLAKRIAYQENWRRKCPFKKKSVSNIFSVMVISQNWTKLHFEIEGAVNGCWSKEI